MAYITAEIKVPTIHRTLTTQLYFPTDLPDSVGNKVNGVITLLHGMSNTASDWMMMTAAPRYAADNGYVLVALNADNSFYLDMAYGDDFYTALTEYLPQQLHRIFRLPTEREKNFIAGLSMGGYGALRIALSHPERYAACGSFSGSLAAREMLSQAREDGSLYKWIVSLIGNDLQLPQEADLFHLAGQVARLPAAQQPRILCTCGRQDSEKVGIQSQNRAFCRHAGTLGLDCSYLEWDGDHTFSVWDRSLAEFIAFIQGSSYALDKQKDWSSGATPVQL